VHTFFTTILLLLQLIRLCRVEAESHAPLTEGWSDLLPPLPAVDIFFVVLILTALLKRVLWLVSLKKESVTCSGLIYVLKHSKTTEHS